MSDTEDFEKQSVIHDALVGALTETGTLEDGQLLTGWCLCFESQNVNEPASAGHVYGPAGMTTWRAIGLVEWAKCFGLTPDNEDDE